MLGTEPTRRAHKRRTITSASALDELDTVIRASAEIAAVAVKQLLNSTTPIDALAALRFTEAGRDPLDPHRALNFVEQLNQSFTYLATVAAARWLERDIQSA